MNACLYIKKKKKKDKKGPCPTGYFSFKIQFWGHKLHWEWQTRILGRTVWKPQYQNSLLRSRNATAPDKGERHALCSFMYPFRPERTKVTKHQTVSLKVQLLCWLWVSGLSPMKALAAVLLGLFFSFFFSSIYREKEGNILFTWITGSASELTFACFPHPLQFILQEQPEWDLKTHQTLNLFHSKMQLLCLSTGVKAQVYTICSHIHLPYCADRISHSSPLTLLQPQASLPSLEHTWRAGPGASAPEDPSAGTTFPWTSLAWLKHQHQKQLPPPPCKRAKSFFFSYFYYISDSFNPGLLFICPYYLLSIVYDRGLQRQGSLFYWPIYFNYLEQCLACAW